MSSVARYSRQARLSEVGEERQAALSRAEVRVRTGGLRGEIEARFLAGAGIGRIIACDDSACAAAREVNTTIEVVRGDGAPETQADAPAHWPAARDESAAEVVAGAMSALEAIRSLLSTGGSGHAGADDTPLDPQLR